MAAVFLRWDGRRWPATLRGGPRVAMVTLPGEGAAPRRCGGPSVSISGSLHVVGEELDCLLFDRGCLLILWEKLRHWDTGEWRPVLVL